MKNRQSHRNHVHDQLMYALYHEILQWLHESLTDKPATTDQQGLLLPTSGIKDEA
ncbi:MAG: hypothetical protein MUC61_00900 [Amoebophilaceae bacterium]|nr:hypothetical protein [Amoebophilaceae bacterium]